MYKIVNNIDKVDKSISFLLWRLVLLPEATQKSLKIDLDIIRATSFSNRVVNTWNSLTENVVRAPSLKGYNQGCILIYGITGIHVSVFIKVYVFDTAQHQKYLADFNNLNTKLTAII